MYVRVVLNAQQLSLLLCTYTVHNVYGMKSKHKYMYVLVKNQIQILLAQNEYVKNSRRKPKQVGLFWFCTQYSLVWFLPREICRLPFR